MLRHNGMNVIKILLILPLKGSVVSLKWTISYMGIAGIVL